MAFRRAILAFALMLLIPVAARADGSVFRAEGCGDYLFVATTDGFSVLRTDAGQGIKKGDTLRGDVERIGDRQVLDAELGRTIFVQVAEAHLTPSEATEQVAIHCRAPLGATVTSGYVTRATGCGNKIFVDTPQGFAVLDRLAGGVVADGDTLTGNFNRPGRTTVQDTQSASSLVVFVEDIWLSRSAMQRKVAASCRK